MEMLILGMCMLYGVFVWRAWKRTALDCCRDKLFDIRDGARAYFIERGTPLDDRVHIGLRRLLNAQIRYTKRVTFPGFIATALATKDGMQIMEEIKREINDSMETNDPELAAYIRQARSKATAALTQYIGETSAVVLFVSVVSMPVLAVRRAIVLLRRWMDYQNKIVFASARIFASVMASTFATIFSIVPVAGFMISMPAKAGIVKKGTTSEMLLEEYAYEQRALA